MFTFIVSRYFPKAFHRLDDSVRILERENTRKKLSLNPASSLGLEIRTGFIFVTHVPIICSPKQLFAPFFYRAYFPMYRNHLRRNSSPGHFSEL
jgi:hypothetical protein